MDDRLQEEPAELLQIDNHDWELKCVSLPNTKKLHYSLDMELHLSSNDANSIAIKNMTMYGSKCSTGDVTPTTAPTLSPTVSSKLILEKFVNGSEAGHHKGHQVGISDDGNIVAVASSDNYDGEKDKNVEAYVKVYNSETGENQTANIPEDVDIYLYGYEITLSGDGKTLAVGDWATEFVYVYDTDNLKTVPQIIQPRAGLQDNAFGYSLSLSQDGRRLVVSYGASNRVEIFEKASNTFTRFREISFEEIDLSEYYTKVDISDNGNIIAFFYLNPEDLTKLTLKVYDVDKNEFSYKDSREITLDAEGSLLYLQLSLSGDGKTVVNGFQNQFSDVHKKLDSGWEKISGALDTSQEEHVQSFDLSDDGSILVRGFLFEPNMGDKASGMKVYKYDDSKKIH